MYDERERNSESPVSSASSARVAPAARLEMLDVGGAIAAAERAAKSRVLGDPIEGGDVARALADAMSTAEKDGRAAVVAPAERIAAMRDAMRGVASARAGLVVHAIAGDGGEDVAALADLGWGVLASAGPEDSFDLSIVAHRASEDSGVPFVVVHGLGRAARPAGRAVAMVGIPHDEAVESFLGNGSPARAKGGTHTSMGDRAFAERVPFALGAALRDFGSVTGRRHDAFDKIPLGESQLVIIGAGPVGDALFCATSELRARGYDVGAVHVTSLRPFPGARLVKALARALAITVLEASDEPFTQGGLLARDVKSAFTDALTWVPGFPGIGRIPKLFIGASGPAFDVADLAAICENMLADERGRRIFSFVDVEHALPRASALREEASADARGAREVAIRFVLDDASAAEAVLVAVGKTLVSGAGLRSQGIITSANGAGAVLDVIASRDHARGGMARRAPRLVIATERGVSSAGAVVPLAESAVLAVIGGDPTGALPDAARTIVRERRARVLPLALGGGGDVAIAAVAAGAALAAAALALKTPIEGGAVARIVAESVPGSELDVDGQRARRAFEATRDVLAAASRSEPDPRRPIGVA